MAFIRQSRHCVKDDIHRHPVLIEDHRKTDHHAHITTCHPKLSKSIKITDETLKNGCELTSGLVKKTNESRSLCEDRRFFQDLIALFADKRESKVDKLTNKNDMNIMYNETPSYSLSHCTKSNHHRAFITVSDVKLKDLPSGYQEKEVLGYINSSSRFVVKIQVYTTSRKRNNSEKYGLSDLRKSAVIRQGTGWVSLTHDDNTPEKMNCPNPNCNFSGGPHEVVGSFYVMTAKHLVYDRSEAIGTKITFSNDDMPVEKSDSGWTAEGYDVAYPPEMDRDLVFIKCYSHDLDIFTHLRSITHELLKARKTLVDADITRIPSNPCVFIISHPHGRPKHVCFGTVIDKEEMDIQYDNKTGEKRRGRIMYTYDVPTCPGSSGAPVCVMGTDGTYYYQFPHSIDNEGKGGLNSGLVDWTFI